MSTEFIKAYAEKLAYSIDDIKNCKNEPLANCGAIQSAGFFLSYHAVDGVILSISENLLGLLGLDATTTLGASVNGLFTLIDGTRFDGRCSSEALDKPFPILSALDRTGQTLAFDTHFHSDGNQIGIDLELSPPPSRRSIHKHLHSLISRLERSDAQESDCHFVCESIKEISGFDRVMAYRFQENWDGEVVAEARAAHLTNFLNLRYPAHDIPEQARRLYMKTDFRMIVDTHAVPVPVITRRGFLRTEVCLGLSGLRASSPIHITYLHNMGVQSSFSIPIKVHNRLWGLISCHHTQAPLHIGSEQRSEMQLMTRILAARIVNSIEKRRILTRKNTLEFTQTFVQNLSNGASPKDSFIFAKDQLFSLIASSGAFIRVQGEEVKIGSCPDDDVIDKIIDIARQTTSFGVWRSNSLKQDLGLDCSPREAAGALVVPFSFGFEEVMIWFRREAEQEVAWGGKPQGKVDPNVRLQPRVSFEAWVQKVSNCCFPWTEENEETAQFILFHFIKGIFSKAAALSQSNKELERMTRAKDEFIGMVSHELRTPLSAIIGWIDILKDTVGFGNPEVQEAIEVIDRNAKLQVTLINDLLDISRIISGKLRLSVKSNVKIKSLVRDIIESLRPMASAKEIDLQFHCSLEPLFRADPDRIRQVIWNLLTNAIKFTPHSGRVLVSIEATSQSYTLTVSDTGVGLITQDLKNIFDRFSQVDGGVASRGGLGLGLSIVRSLVELHGGTIEAFSEGLGQGSRFTMTMPVFAVSTESQSSVGTANSSPLPTILDGQRVLIAEDQPDTASALKFTLERMGAVCVVCHDGRKALIELMNSRFDLIISDVGMPEMNGHDLMKAFRIIEHARGGPMTPAIALTAYATSKDRTLALESGFQSHIPKPVDKGELVAVIESLKIAVRS
ncbi:MAG: response regulator [Chitinophagaceae bacterium]|nr:response regulator [Oligoflexus sp.]